MGTAALYIVGAKPARQLKSIEKSWEGLWFGDGRKWCSSYSPYEKWYDDLLQAFPNKQFRCLRKKLKTDYLPYYLLWDNNVYYCGDYDDDEGETYEDGQNKMRNILNSIPEDMLITAMIVKD